MANQRNPFHYDLVLSLDSDKDLYYTILEYKKANEKQRIIAATYDHRFFNIHEKNYIKGLIDCFDLDHLLFTLRPSANLLITLQETIDIEVFKKMSQAIFVLQTMTRYDISTGLLSNRYFEGHGSLDIHAPSCSALEIYFFLTSYLQDLLKRLAKTYHNQKMEKIFCSLCSITNLKSKLENKTIIFQEPFLASTGNDKSELFSYEEQISELEKNLFWVGFDSKFKEVPWEKPYPETRWTKIAKETKWGQPLYSKELRYCNRCCMPETMEGITFDEFGICTPCRSSEEKMHIDWEVRDKRLRKILDDHRSETYYDCMLPMSGGKDSTFQAFALDKRYKVTPLAVTHGHNWMSLTGRYNLENCLQKFDLDHLIFHPNRGIINKAARKSLEAIGDVCWHCHTGAGTFAIQSAYYWNVSLMIWGESIAERDGRGSYINRAEADLYYNLEISARVKAQDYADKTIPYDDLAHWFYPEHEKLQRAKLRYVHLGDYIFWDEEKHVDFIVKNFEWMDSKVENTYKGYKSTECAMAGLHDYANFIKRGIGRATVHASDDVRRGLITREEGMELSKKFDTQRPHCLDYYLSITGYTEDEFEKKLVEARAISKDAIKLKRE